jgi:hypothetical protein
MITDKDIEEIAEACANDLITDAKARLFRKGVILPEGRLDNLKRALLAVLKTDFTRLKTDE